MMMTTTNKNKVPWCQCQLGETIKPQELKLHQSWTRSQSYTVQYILLLREALLEEEKKVNKIQIQIQTSKQKSNIKVPVVVTYLQNSACSLLCYIAALLQLKRCSPKKLPPRYIATISNLTVCTKQRLREIQLRVCATVNYHCPDAVTFSTCQTPRHWCRCPLMCVMEHGTCIPWVAPWGI